MATTFRDAGDLKIMDRTPRPTVHESHIRRPHRRSSRRRKILCPLSARDSRGVSNPKQSIALNLSSMKQYIVLTPIHLTTHGGATALPSYDAYADLESAGRQVTPTFRNGLVVPTASRTTHSTAEKTPLARRQPICQRMGGDKTD